MAARSAAKVAARNLGTMLRGLPPVITRIRVLRLAWENSWKNAVWIAPSAFAAPARTLPRSALTRGAVSHPLR